MDSKKKIAVGMIIVAILIVVSFLFKGGDNSSQSSNDEQATGSITGVLFTNKMTDEINIEVMTQLAKDSISDPGQSDEEMQKETEQILSKYGVTKEEYGRYAEELYNDKARLDIMNQKIMQITLELMKTGGK